MRRLSPGTLIVGMFAILLGLVAAYGVKAYVAAAPIPPPPEPPKPITVPLAAMDLPAGRTIAEGDVMMMPMSREQIAKAKFPPIWMDTYEQIKGRTLQQPLKSRQPFEPTSFYPVGMGPNVADSLEPGQRAVTIPFENDSVDGTFVTPGSAVDVLFRAEPDESANVPDATVTLLSQVKVLAVGRNTLEGTIAGQAEGEQSQTVTLAVNPTQARALKVVEGRGSLSLVLRSPEDAAAAETAGPTTLPGLLGLKDKPAPFVSEIYRAGSLATLTFQDGQRQKMTLDPPYGLPVTRDPKDVPGAGLDIWLPGSGASSSSGRTSNSDLRVDVLRPPPGS